MKRKIHLGLAAFAALSIVSCKNDDNGIDTPVALYPAVETEAPNTAYTPAFEGQTRAAGVQTTTPYTAELFTSALTNPWDIAQLPDGRFLVTEKSGQLRIVTAQGTLSTPITGLPAVNSSGQGGLLGLCIDPAFASNRMLYWTFIQSVGGGGSVAVAKGRLSDNETVVESPVVIYTSTTPATPTSNYGSRIIFDATGNLLVSFGDRTSESVRIEAQSVSSSIGKLLRMDTNGNGAAGNPAFTQAGALPQLYSMGHRNPQGIAIHPVTGDIWQSEHGPRGGDEINRIVPGANYGWPVISYGLEYSGQPVGGGIQQQNGMEQPVYYWDPVVSPSGITFYTGNNIPEWENNLFLCSLTQTHLIRLVIDSDNRVTGEERLLAAEGQRFRDVTQGTDGALYAITDGGRLYKIDRQD